MIVLTPHVDPEHQELIDMAQQQVDYYSKMLLEKLIPKQHTGLSIEPIWRIEDRIRAQREFFTDPVREHLISNLGMLKVMYEKPRILFKR